MLFFKRKQLDFMCETDATKIVHWKNLGCKIRFRVRTPHFMYVSSMVHQLFDHWADPNYMKFYTSPPSELVLLFFALLFGTPATPQGLRPEF